ncbi:hypothetical protein D9752_01125 [Lactiplantibacillus plantarum]|nr:hypothetical protein D9752_01125 [Lactiplantibacillus plantarum]
MHFNCKFVSSKIASLGQLEKVRISVNLFSWLVLHRLPGISANCRNVVGTDLSRKITSQILAFQ